jgi:hypothetical protein
MEKWGKQAGKEGRKMAAKPLDKRVSILEHEVAALKKAVAKEGAVKDWRRSVGMFEGDELMQ